MHRGADSSLSDNGMPLRGEVVLRPGAFLHFLTP